MKKISYLLLSICFFFSCIDRSGSGSEKSTIKLENPVEIVVQKDTVSIDQYTDQDGVKTDKVDTLINVTLNKQK